MNGQNTLHLFLKSVWYDKIASGEKTSEYRECKPYWNKKIAGGAHILVRAALFMPMRFEQKTEYKTVIFHKVYTKETMEFKINGLFLIQNVPNDLNSSCCWEIKLGQRIK